MRLRLETRQDGKTTWEGLLPVAAPEAEAAAAPSSPTRVLQVAGLELRDGEAVWSNEAGARYELKGVELTTGSLGGGEPSDFSLAFTLTGLGGPPVLVRVRSRLTLDAARSRIVLENVEGKIDQSNITGRLASEPGTGPGGLRVWRGQLAIDRVRTYGLTASDVKTEIESKGGVARIGPATGRFYGGQYRGTFDIDAGGAESQADRAGA